jgi:hypothetical protein
LPYKTFSNPSAFPPNHQDLLFCGGHFYTGARRAPEGQRQPDWRMRAHLKECGLL